MPDRKIYEEPSKVEAREGAVVVDGRDEVDVDMTPEAAEETSERLLTGSMKARGQRRLQDQPHRPK
jgi:cytidylate kinase